MFKKFINKIFNKPKIRLYGINNKIKISPKSYVRRLSISVYGNSNNIEIEDNAYIHNTRIILGFAGSPVENCRIKIGKGTSINSILIQVGETESVVNIGENCMFSFGIEINCTDHHAIFDEENNLINRGKFVQIGNNVWVCKEVRIMKNTVVPDGCIVAQRGIVTKEFIEKNSILAGNPAKIVKRNIRWDRKRPNQFL